MKRLELPLLSDVWAIALTLGVKYGFGRKFSDIKRIRPTEKKVDCSGMLQWLIYHASGGEVTIADGSVMQRIWFESRGFRPVAYKDALRYADPSRVFICFIRPVGPLAGHVWLLKAGRTMESYGGHGIGSLSGHNLYRKMRCKDCFEIA